MEARALYDMNNSSLHLHTGAEMPIADSDRFKIDFSIYYLLGSRYDSIVGLRF